MVTALYFIRQIIASLCGLISVSEMDNELKEQDGHGMAMEYSSEQYTSDR